ncbi:MAG: WG repeat-containing protein [Fusobacteriaceae bacterium]
MKFKLKIILIVIILTTSVIIIKGIKENKAIENYNNIFKEYVIKGTDNNLEFENQYKGKKYKFNKFEFNRIISLDDERVIFEKDTLGMIRSKKETNKESKEIINTEYKYVSLLGDRIIVSKDEKYGLLDLELNLVVPAIYTWLSGSVESDILTAKLEEKIGYINKRNEKIVPFEYENGTTEKLNMMIVMKDKKIGVIDRNSNIIIDFKYDAIYYDDRNNFLVKEEENYYSVNLKEKKKEKIDVSWVGVVKENIAFYEKDGKFGLMKLTGEKLTENLYEEFPMNYNDMIIGKLENKYGLINQQGEKIVEFKYDYIIPLGNYVYEVGIDEKDKIEIIDNKGKYLIDGNYDNITELNKTYLILSKDKKTILFNKNKKSYEEIDEILGRNKELFIYKKENKTYVKKLKER